MIELTQEEAARRLNNPENLSVLIKFNRGIGNHNGNSRRKVGDVKTDSEKELIANIAIDNKLRGISYKDTAREFGIHPTTVGDYTRGAFNNSPVPNDEKSIRKPQVMEERVSSKALDRLVSALDLLTEDKMDKANASDLASVAVKMATVNEKINGNEKSGNKISIIICPPTVMREEHFDIIEVSQ